MIKLTEYEHQMIEGKHGELKRIALENIVRYGEVLGAEELCKITKATVFCGAHGYLDFVKSDDFHEIFTKMNLGKNNTIKFDSTDNDVYIQSCVAPCDQFEFENLNLSKDFFDKNSNYLEECKKAGVNIVGSCAPYLTGWLPIRGEHFVTTESGVTTIGNSLWGAMCNSDGIEAAFWSSICGRTPKWGMHDKKNRYGTHLIEVNTEINSVIDWDLLGKAIGKNLPSGAVPVVKGNFKDVNFEKLAQLFTTISMASNCELCHVLGYTPEAETMEQAFNNKNPKKIIEINSKDLQEAYNIMCGEGETEIDFVSLGCPHYNIDRIRKVAEYLKNKKINPKVHFMIWTVYPIKAISDLNGYTNIIEKAGGKIYTSSCPTTIGIKFLENYEGLLFDSYKQARSVKSDIEKNVYYGDMYSCIDAAIEGKWREEYRWKP